MFQETFCCYKFDEFLLYPDERLLLRNGKRVNLRGKDFDVLVYPVKKQKRLVTHQELLKEVWQGAFVEEGNITTSISKIRKVLGDNSRSPKYIESIKGYGYRFLLKTETAIHLEQEKDSVFAFR
ncbi:MAG: winged helix-turn-helix domain-containing protein [Pyrinomonadaceae bacterium]